MPESYKQVPMYRYLMVLTIASMGGLQVWRTLFNNFAVDAAHLNGDQVGVIQSAREIPGFLALLAIFVIRLIPEHRLAALSILTLGLGVGITGFFPSFTGLIGTTLLMSFGFHYFETTNQSLTLQYFEHGEAPRVFGRLRSVAAAVNIGVGLAILLLAGLLDYRNIYLLMSLLVISTAVWAFFQTPADRCKPAQRKKMVLRKKYWLFYLLTFMAGARRQIFVAFAVFLLVKRFGFSVQEITALFVVNNIINYFLSPFLGKAIVRFGERRVLSLEYGSLLFVFLGYAFTASKVVVAMLYILDHIFFNFSIAIRTYFQKIGDPKDIAPSMAVGFTINHIAAVVVPAMGGMLWMIDYRIPFFAGALLSLVSLASVQCMGRRFRS